jgi:hypothetical protein
MANQTAVAGSENSTRQRRNSALDKGLLSARVIRELEGAGFLYGDSGLLTLPDVDDVKELYRNMHRNHRRQVLLKNAKFLDEWEDQAIEHFADGSEVDPNLVNPRVEVVETPEQAALFRFASLHWSVPVSQGFGRRTRFLVRDQHNDKLAGIFALGDPVFNLSARDKLIGWDHKQRQERLYNVYDAYVLGAVEPYRGLIGGKLIALCTLASETSEYLVAKYSGRTTQILKRKKNPVPALISTTSSLGRSSTYSRLKYHDRWAFQSIGYTEGFGHFHFSESLFQDLVQYLRGQGEETRGYEYGNGPNWRIRTIRAALEAVGLDGDLLKHGLRREIFIAPTGKEWKSYLTGKTDCFQSFDVPLDELATWWRVRWGIPRSRRDPSFADHTRERMRLSPELDSTP